MSPGRTPRTGPCYRSVPLATSPAPHHPHGPSSPQAQGLPSDGLQGRWATRDHLISLPLPAFSQQAVDLGAIHIQSGIISIVFIRIIPFIKKKTHTPHRDLMKSEPINCTSSPKCPPPNVSPPPGCSFLRLLTLFKVPFVQQTFLKILCS